MKHLSTKVRHRRTLRKNVLSKTNTISESDSENVNKKNKSIISNLPIAISLYTFIENHSDKIKSFFEYLFS